MEDVTLSVVIVIGLDTTHEVCYSLHGQPPKNTHVAQTNTTGNQGVYLFEGNMMSSFNIEQVEISTSSLSYLA